MDWRTKSRKRRSAIWSWKKDDIASAVNSSEFFSDILRKFGVNNVGGNVRTLKKKLKEEGIDFSHIKHGRNHWKGSKRKFKTQPLEYYFSQKRKINARLLKRRLYSEGLKAEKCESCGIKDVWNNKKLILQLNHIDGNRENNLLENLEILCPNCHSQTDTFTSKNKIRYNNTRTWQSSNCASL